MIRRHHLAACGFALSFFTIGVRADALPPPPLEPGTRTMRATIDLDAPIEVAWNAFTTSEGMSAWAAPKADIDLSIGGLFKTSYDPAADLDGPNAIHQRVLAYEPLRMLSLRTVKAPEGFPHAHAITHTWGVTWFEELGPNRTRMTFTSMGWQDGSEWDAAWAFFEAGNAGLFQRMQTEFGGDVAESLRAKPEPLRSVVHEVVVPTPPAEAWTYCATVEGVTAWMAPNAKLDLRVGGTIRTNYDTDAEIGGPGTITHHILTFQPERLIAFRFDAPDTAPPAAQRAESCWWMIELEPVDGGASTHIRFSMHGFGEGTEWDETYRFFDAGNKQGLDQLAKQFADDAQPEMTIRHPALRELHRLAGGEWIHESTMPDGSVFLVRNVITAGPDGRSLITRGWLGDDTGLFEHAAAQIWMEPGTDDVRFQTIDEHGAIARGTITLDENGVLHWDWNRTADAGSVASFDVRMRFTGEDIYEFSIARPGDNAEEVLLDKAIFRRVAKAPAKFMKTRPAPRAEDHAEAQDETVDAPEPGRDRVFRVDPVTLIVEGKEMPGDADITAKHDKFTYRFATAANRAAFVKNPEKYEIQLGGSCARMGALSGEGHTDLFTVYEGRLYIFASESCRNTFLKSADNLLYQSDPRLETTPELTKAGRAILDRAIAAHGGAPRWQAINAVRRIDTETVKQAETDWLHVETVTIRFPRDYREQSDWNELQYARAMTDVDQWFERERRTEVEPMHLQQRIEFEDAFNRELAVVLRAGLARDLRVAAAGETTLDLGTEGEITVDLVKVQVDGATTTLGVDRDRGYVRMLEYRGRGPSLAYGTVRRVLYDFRSIGAITLPFAEIRFFDEKLVNGWSDRRPVIEINPQIDTGEFKRPVNAGE